MQALLFTAGTSQYALAFTEIERVLGISTLARSRALPGAPHGVIGLVRDRGMWIPVVDLVLLLNGQPCARRASSRLVVVDLSEGARYAILVEDAMHSAPISRVQNEFQLPGSSFLGGFLKDGVQLIKAKSLLTQEMVALYHHANKPAESSHA